MTETKQRAKAYFAGGCFWGLEYYFQKLPGVLSTTVGYMGGHTANPSYEEVCTGRTGHAETLEVVFDTQKVDFEQLARLFFELHDFTQVDGQGPDLGTQYRSVIFYNDEAQRQVAEKLIKILEAKDYKVATQVVEAGPFYKAEDYHQDYYQTRGGEPYCHSRRKIF